MIEPNSRLERDLKAAEEIFELARTTSSPLCARTISASLSGPFVRGRSEIEARRHSRDNCYGNAVQPT